MRIKKDIIKKTAELKACREALRKAKEQECKKVGGKAAKGIMKNCGRGNPVIGAAIIGAAK